MIGLIVLNLQKSEAIKFAAWAAHLKSKTCEYDSFIILLATLKFGAESVTTAANLCNPTFSINVEISFAMKTPVWLTVLYTFSLIKYSLHLGIVTI